MAEESHKVLLHVYDLSQGLARQLSMTFLGKAIEGIWHTGIVVYGSEYYFGGGIQHSPVGTTPYGTPMKVLDLGTTLVTKDVFEEYLHDIRPQYTAETYNLLTHNCNNFSNEVAQFLVGTTIPDYILNLPNDVRNSPMGPLIMPLIQQLESTLRSGAVPQAPVFKVSTLSATSRPTSSTLSSSRVTEEAERKAEEQSGGSGQPKTFKKQGVNGAVKSGGLEVQAKPSINKIAGDPLGDARSKVHDEISEEFAAIMATGTFRASEAAALATKKVMQRYGHPNVAQN